MYFQKQTILTTDLHGKPRPTSPLSSRLYISTCSAYISAELSLRNLKLSMYYGIELIPPLTLLTLLHLAQLSFDFFLSLIPSSS